MRTAAAVVLAALGLAGCAGMQEQSWPIAEKWAVSPNASPECLSAARRASHYCLDKTLNSDIWGGYTSECTKARWDHARYC